MTIKHGRFIKPIDQQEIHPVSLGVLFLLKPGLRPIINPDCTLDENIHSCQESYKASQMIGCG